MQNQKGFSLIELIVVMAIMGIAAGIAVFVYNNMKPQIRLNGASRQVMGDMMWARMKAISQNNEFKIFFLDNHRYQILDDDDNDVTKDIQDKYHDVTFTSTANPIFHPKGNAAPAATINLMNSHGTKTVTIAITGRVKIN